MWGSDQAASIEPQGLKRLVKDIRNVEAALGDGRKRVYESEVIAATRLRLKDTLADGTRSVPAT
jgi:sialic acid synthase SpsE